MPQFHINKGGTWYQAKQLWFNRSGTWHNAKQLWINKGGVWTQAFSSFAPRTGAQFTSTTTSNINPQIRFQADGTVRLRTNTNGTTTANWGLPTTAGVGSGYTITISSPTGSGSGAVTGTFNSAQSMSGEVIVTLGAANLGNGRYATCTYVIRDLSGNTMGSGSFYLENDRT